MYNLKHFCRTHWVSMRMALLSLLKVWLYPAGFLEWMWIRRIICFLSGIGICRKMRLPWKIRGEYPFTPWLIRGCYGNVLSIILIKIQSWLQREFCSWQWGRLHRCWIWKQVMRFGRKRKWFLIVWTLRTGCFWLIKAVIWTGCLTSWKAIALRREKRCGAGKWAMYMDGMRVVYWMTLLDWLSRMGFIWFTWEMGKGRVMPCRLGQVIIKRPSLLVRSVWWRVS